MASCHFLTLTAACAVTQSQAATPRLKVAGRLLRCGLEDHLGELAERLLPVLEVMFVLVHMPRVGHVLGLELSMHLLTDPDEAVLVAA